MEVSPNIHTSECDSGTGSVCSDYLEEVETEKVEVVKKMIKPDVSVMTKLLNFNEEDEDDLTDTDDDETNEKVSVPSLFRRHSVSVHRQSHTQTTLSLKLEGVKHIRSVLTKAKLESLPVQDSVLQSFIRGLMCSLCLKTKFSVFSAGVRRSLCSQLVCRECVQRVKVGEVQCSEVPLIPLTPTTTSQGGTPPNSTSSTPCNPPLTSPPNNETSLIKDSYELTIVQGPLGQNWSQTVWSHGKNTLGITFIYRNFIQ